MFKRNFTTIAVSFVVLIQLILSFQGFDICDEGFSLTFYQQFYNDPASVEYNFAYWLSGLFGGIWYQLFPSGGILWFRILGLIINTGTLVLGYIFLKSYINKYIAFLGLVMALFINDFGFMVFYHNHLTSFLAVLAIITLVRGLDTNRWIYIGLSGFICALNVFSRLPNLTLFIFVLAIPLYAYYTKFRFKQVLARISLFSAGAIFGFGLVAFILLVLNQYEIMQRSILGILDSGNSSKSAHNFMSLFGAYGASLYAILKAIIKMSIIVFPLILISKRIKNNKLSYGLLISVGIIAFIYVFYVKNVFPLYGIGLIGGLSILFFGKDTIVKTITFLAVAMALVLPFGSDGAMYNAGFMCLWLLIPMALHFIYSIETFNFSNTLLKQFVLDYQYQFKLLVVIIGAGYFMCKPYKLSNEAYFDPGSRFDKIYAIDSDFTRGIYTTKDRAIIVNAILPELKKHVKPNDVLFAYEHLPMLHFLTETKPYLNNPWVMIYDGYIFEKQLKIALKNHDDLPIVVQQKFQTIVKFFEPEENYMSETKPEVLHSSQRRTKAMNQFLNTNGYKIIFSNSHFNIYKAK